MSCWGGRAEQIIWRDRLHGSIDVRKSCLELSIQLSMHQTGMHVLDRTRYCNQRGNTLHYLTLCYTMLHQCIFILGHSTGGSKASDLHRLEIAKYYAKSSVNYFGTCPKFKRFSRPRVVIPNFYDYNPPTFVVIASQFWIVNSQLLSIVHVSNPFKYRFSHGFPWFCVS